MAKSPERPRRSPSRSPAPSESSRSSSGSSSSTSGSFSSGSSRSSRSKSPSSRSSRSSKLRRSKTPKSKTRSRSRSRSPHHSKSRSRSRARSSRDDRRRSASPPNPKIHVNRLTKNVNKNHLSEIFSTYGPIKSIDLPMDRYHPQLGRGTAYIEFEKFEDAEKAIKYMDGGQIDGQEITVSEFRRNRMAPRRPISRSHHNRNGTSWRKFPIRR